MLSEAKQIFVPRYDSTAALRLDSKALVLVTSALRQISVSGLNTGGRLSSVGDRSRQSALF